MHAECLCGAVRVTIAARPDYINDCNCTLCRKSGGVWGYFPGADVRVEGETAGMVRPDMDEPAVEMRFCPKCGSTTHWVLTRSYQAAHPDTDRVGVNMRLFDPGALIGAELRFPDGLNWTQVTPRQRRSPLRIGPDFRW